MDFFDNFNELFLAVIWSGHDFFNIWEFSFHDFMLALFPGRLMSLMRSKAIAIQKVCLTLDFIIINLGSRYLQKVGE